MAKRRRTTRRQADHVLTPDRLRRIYRLVKALAARPYPRHELLRRLQVEQRTFYRDLEWLRQLGIRIVLQDKLYILETPLTRVLQCLPVPDPQLTLAEAQILAQGRTLAHRKLKRFLQSVFGTID